MSFSLTDTESKILIRLAIHEDAPTLASFMIAMAKETEDKDLDPETVNKGAASCIANPKYAKYLIAYIPSSANDDDQ